MMYASFRVPNSLSVIGWASSSQYTPECFRILAYQLDTTR